MSPSAPFSMAFLANVQPHKVILLVFHQELRERPLFNERLIDRAAVRCVLQRRSSRQNPMRRRTGESWNMLMKEARYFVVVGTLCATASCDVRAPLSYLTVSCGLCYCTALAMAF